MKTKLDDMIKQLTPVLERFLATAATRMRDETDCAEIRFYLTSYGEDEDGTPILSCKIEERHAFDDIEGRVSRG